jgi:hypothetical protein
MITKTLVTVFVIPHVQVRYLHLAVDAVECPEVNENNLLPDQVSYTQVNEK